MQVTTPIMVFRVPKALRVLVTCLLVPLAAFFIAGPFLLLSDPTVRTSTWSILLVLGLGLGAIVVLLLLATYQSRVEIRSESIRKVGVFQRGRELRFSEIDGFRITQGGHSRYLVFVPKDKTRKPLRLELVFERQQELLDWTQTHFRNLDVEEAHAELQGILADESLGFSEEQRVEALKRARKHAMVLNVATTGAVLWVLFHPQPYGVALAVIAALPWAAVLLVPWSHGLVQFDETTKSARPTVAPAWILPAIILALRALLDWHILEWSHFWLPFFAIGLMATVVVLFCFADARKKVATLITVPLICFVYSYGLTVHLNCYYDRSAPEVHRTVVQSRRLSTGKHTSYHLTLRPWLGRPETEEVDVGRVVYERHAEGSTAVIVVREGALAVKWYFVR